MREVLQPKANKGVIGQAFKTEAKALLPYLESLRGDACIPLQQALKEKGVCTVAVHGKPFELTDKMVEVTVCAPVDLVLFRLASWSKDSECSD